MSQERYLPVGRPDPTNHGDRALLDGRASNENAPPCLVDPTPSVGGGAQGIRAMPSSAAFRAKPDRLVTSGTALIVGLAVARSSGGLDVDGDGVGCDA
jgi:hypothetical protein